MPKVSENQLYVKKYTEDDIQKALKAVHDGMSKKMAAKKFNVPRATIQFRLSNNFVKTRPGPSTVLSEREENQLEEWLILSSRKGFPRRKDDVLESVQEFLRKNPRDSSFVDMRPGKGWYKLFLQRHPALSLRQSEAVTSSSAKISETDIRKWFEQIMIYLKEMKYDDILDDPSRVFNGDETGFLFNPKDSKVIAPKGDKNVYDIEHAPSKTSLTVMFSFSANGTLTPPMVVFPLKRMRKEILQSVPESWDVGMSENGWMKSETFFNYIKNVLHPFLVTNGTKFPIILFLDGHKSHTTLELSQLCQSLDIILISLYPNATRLLQPAGVAAFRPIKSAWRKAVLDWRKKNLTKTLTKVDFGPILENVINSHIRPNILINGFRACGLVPWNPNAIDYSKCLGRQRANLEKTAVSENANLSYSKFQEIVGPVVMRRLANDNIGKSGEAKALQKIYKYFLVVNETSQDMEHDDLEVVDVREDREISQEEEAQKKNETKKADAQEKNENEKNTNIIVPQSTKVDSEEKLYLTENKNSSESSRIELQDNEIKMNIDIENNTQTFELRSSDNADDVPVPDESINCHLNVDAERHISINGELISIDDMPIILGDDIVVDNNTVVSTSVESKNISPVHSTSSVITSNEFIPLPSCSFKSEEKEKTPEKRRTTLKEILVLPKTPIRNSKVKSLKQPFVLTSRDWQKIEFDKIEKKNKILLEKEDRKRKREEKRDEIEANKKKKEEDKKKKAKHPSLIKKTKIMSQKTTPTADCSEDVKILTPIEGNTEKEQGNTEKEEQKTLKQIINTKPIILSNILLKPANYKTMKKEQDTIKPVVLSNIVVKPSNQKQKKENINKKQEKENINKKPTNEKAEKDGEKPLKVLSTDDIRRILEEE